MDKDLTRYEVLRPTGIENLYEVVGTFAYAADSYQTRTPEYIKKILVASGKYPQNIIVRYAR